MSCDGAHVSGGHADVITHAILNVCVCVCRASERERDRDIESVSERERGGGETFACISRTARISLMIQLPRQGQAVSCIKLH